MLKLILILDKTKLDSYIAVKYRRPTNNLPIKYIPCIYLKKSLPYLIPRRLFFLKNLSIYTIYPTILLIGLPIYIFTLYLNPY